MQKMASSIFISIFKTQVKRLGLFRVMISAIFMYITAPFFILLHLTILILSSRLFFKYFFNISLPKSKKYVILDRYNIKKIGFFDRLNCLFCEYANGVIVLVEVIVDRFANYSEKYFIFKKILFFLLIILQVIVLLSGIILITIPTNIIVSLLGLHRASYRIIANNLSDSEYAKNYNNFMRSVVRLYKILIKVVSYNLEQIESGWCPIKHLVRDDYVTPAHHKNFYNRNDLYNMQNTLRKQGSVSDKLPKF